MPAVAEGVPLTCRHRSHKLPKLDDQQRNQVDVSKRKRRLTAAEKAAKKRRKAEFRTVFINGKQKRVRRPPTIDGMDVDEFIRRNADPIFLHEMEMWELMEQPDAPGEADEMREEYDFSGGVRGKYAARNSDLTMIVEPDGDGFVSFCAELDVWSQGSTAEEARANLAEALELFLETADAGEIRRRLGGER
jgi:predicted RNase H-like HicB family nuclease